MEKEKNVHFIGIGGSGISYAACLAALNGFQVSGCDLRDTHEYTKDFKQLGINSVVGEDKKHLVEADFVVISPAVTSLNPNHVEVAEAKERNIPVLTWQEFVGKYLLKDRFVIAIAGTHGKGTTTSMVGLMLEELGLDPTVGVGAIVPKWGKNYRYGKSLYFVIEADEYNNNFHNYSPDLLGITNLEMDHPEYFESEKALFESFETLAQGVKNSSKSSLVLNRDSKLSKDLYEKILTKRRVLGLVTVGHSLPENISSLSWFSIDDPGADFYAEKITINENGLVFDLIKDGKNLGAFVVPLYGKHNLSNTLAALSVIFSIVDPTSDNVKAARNALRNFQGAKRRFEVRTLKNGLTLIDDYAHHPTAIDVTIRTTKEVFKNKKIWAIYQPHMFTRTKHFYNDFLNVFRQNQLDQMIVTDIFAAREKDTGEVSSRQLVEDVNSENVKYIPRDTLVEYLKRNRKDYEVLLIMGAGDINEVSEHL